MQLIKSPMDLSTMVDKVLAGKYKGEGGGSSGEDLFLQDAQLIWSNCATFNKSTTSAAKAGKECQSRFAKLFEVGIANRETRPTNPILTFSVTGDLC